VIHLTKDTDTGRERRRPLSRGIHHCIRFYTRRECEVNVRLTRALHCHVRRVAENQRPLERIDARIAQVGAINAGLAMRRVSRASMYPPMPSTSSQHPGQLRATARTCASSASGLVRRRPEHERIRSIPQWKTVLVGEAQTIVGCHRVGFAPSQRRMRHLSGRQVRSTAFART
jgi:hypothetical protein